MNKKNRGEKEIDHPFKGDMKVKKYLWKNDCFKFCTNIVFCCRKQKIEKNNCFNINRTILMNPLASLFGMNGLWILPQGRLHQASDQLMCYLIK